MKLIFSGSLKLFVDFPLLPFSIIGYSIFITVFFSFYTLLLSSISKSRRYVIILIVGIYFFSDILAAIFLEFFSKPLPLSFIFKSQSAAAGCRIFWSQNAS